MTITVGKPLDDLILSILIKSLKGGNSRSFEAEHQVYNREKPGKTLVLLSIQAVSMTFN